MATIDRGARAAGRASSEILDRLPPQNLDAEKGVLGSLLLDPEVCDDVALIIRSEDFYAPANVCLYGHLLAMHNEGLRVDVTLLVERLKKAGDLEIVGGMSYLAEIVQSVPTAANANYYAQIVHDKGTLRALIHASTEILRDAYDQSLEARELLARAEEKVFGILDQKGAGELTSMQDVLHEALERIDARLMKGGGIGGMATGFADLDSLTGGLHESELVILAARPSMGKTALATNIADHVSIDLGLPTLFVSLEMSRLELAERMLCAQGRINGHRLRNGFISPADRKKLIEASSTMSKAPLYIDDSPSRTMTEIAATARRLKRRQNLALVVIDYLQLIEPDNPKDPRQEQVAKIARRLKGMARELRLPVLCLAQLNRQAEVTRDNRPRLSHLRESGAIEQDADVVMFIYREDAYMRKDDWQDTHPDQPGRSYPTGVASVIIAKHRNGPTGQIDLRFHSRTTKFEDLAVTG
jgi:replicative DNA helicase